MVTKKTWEEFRQTGLLLFVNSFLHIFGWAIVLEMDKDGEIKAIYPYRVKFRGFNEKSITNAHGKLAKYMAENSEELLKDLNE